MDKQNQTKNKNEKEEAPTKRLAVIRIRGDVHLRKDIKDTLKHLNLEVVNNCAVIDDRKQYKGMIQKVKDYVAWGEIDTPTFKKLLKARGEIMGGTPLDDNYMKTNTRFSSVDEFTEAFMNLSAELKDIPKLKKKFRLKPPQKGHRGGIKKPVSLGGSLGYWGTEINKLVERMI